MAKIQAMQSFQGKPTGEVYQAVLKAAPKAGLEVWKRRDIAWLVMVRSGAGGKGIDGNISVRPGGQVTVALSAGEMSEDDLQARAGAVFEELSTILG